MIFLIYCWNWFTNILLRIFASMFVIDVCMCCYWYWPVIFFVWFLCNFLIFVGILYQDDAGIVEWLGSDKSVIIWDSLRRIGVNFSLNIWYNSPVKSSGPGLLFLRRFFKKLFTYLWLHWIFVAVLRLSLVAASGGPLSVAACERLIVVASLVEHRLWAVGFSSCGTWAQ